MQDPAAIARRFLDAWATHDLEAITHDFADDIRFVNGSVSVVQGRDTLRQLYGAYLQAYDSFRFETIALAVASDGCTVLNERMDYMIKDGRAVEIPCAGAIVVRDGCITEIRDYFDFAAVQAQNRVDI